MTEGCLGIRVQRQHFLGVRAAARPIGQFIERRLIAVQDVDEIVEDAEPAIVGILFQSLPNDWRRLIRASELRAGQRDVAAIDWVIGAHESICRAASSAR